MSANKQGSTRGERQSKKHITPEKIENGRACPTIEVQAHNAHIDFYKRYQKKQANNAIKAFDLIQWQLDDMHKVLNPRNMGKTAVEYVNNPDFDQSKPVSASNPFFIQQVVAAFQPDKYRPNQVKDMAKEVLSVNDEHIKQLQQQEKEERVLQRKAELAAKDSDNITPEKEVFSTESLLDMSDWEADESVAN